MDEMVWVWIKLKKRIMKKIRNNKKDKAKRVFCSFVAKLVKDNWDYLFQTKEQYKHHYKLIKKDVDKAFCMVVTANKDLNKDIIFTVNDNVYFVKSGNMVIRIDVNNYEIEMNSGKLNRNVTKVSFVKLNFDEIPYKQAKRNKSIDFELTKWISDNK